jgi:hypothetical protein
MKPTQYDFAATLGGSRVDKVAGVIRDVSIITSGVTARGHNLEVDETTLAQMLACADSKKRVAVKWNHQTGADAVAGYLKNFRVQGNKLKADWHLLKSHERFNHAMELAEEMPEMVGLSASFLGQSELADGTKVFEPDEKTKTQFTLVGDKRVPVPKGKKIFARCKELASVDLVSTPAANPSGLFEAGHVDTSLEDMADKPTPGGEPTLADVLAGLNNLSAAITSQGERLGALENFHQEFSAALAAEEEPELEEEVHTEFGDAEEAVHYLSSRLQQIEDTREQEREAHAFQVIEDKMNDLMAVNEELAEQNLAMAGALKEFAAKTKSRVRFEAGAEGLQSVIESSERPGKGGKLTDFQIRVKELKAAGKEATEAISFAVGEDPDRYERHLEDIGAKRA